MKKVIIFMFVFLFLVIPTRVYASSTSVDIKVNGEVRKGATIEILVNVKDVENFYAASVDFKYDINQLKVESIVASDFITKYENNIMDLGSETAKNGNTASYAFTFLGEQEGIKGSGTLVIITAQVLNDEKLSIGQDNMKVKLVKRVGDTVENYDYKFNGYNNLNSINNLYIENSSANNESSVEKDNINNDNISGNEIISSNNTSNSSDNNKNNQSENSIVENNDNSNDNELEKSNNEKDIDESLLEMKNNKTSKMFIVITAVVIMLGVSIGARYYFYGKKGK